MARNVSLGELIDDVRAEAGHSLQANLGVAMREVLIKVLQRQQKRLWEDYDWTFLKVQRDVVVQNGQRYYNIPADMTLERITKLEFKSLVAKFYYKSFNIVLHYVQSRKATGKNS